MRDCKDLIRLLFEGGKFKQPLLHVLHEVG